MKKCISRFNCLLLILIFCNITYANAMQINYIDKQLDIPAILKLQQHMIMSNKPAEISKQPAADCFEVNINAFIPNPSSKDKKIYGCIFSDQVTMNAALLRAGLYVHTDLGMASDAQLFNSKLMKAVGGHDFLGKELVKYNQNKQIPVDTAHAHAQLKDIEQKFHDQILDKIIASNDDNFIFFGVINTKNFKANLSHELLHAQYYNVPEIAAVLLQVWQNSVSPEDKKLITTCLQNGGYDIKQQELILREFYSYFLQYDAVAYLKTIKVLADMAPLAQVYATQIAKGLTKHKIKILTIQ